MSLERIQQEVGEVFRQTFGRTPLRSRLDDIMREAIELNRATDIPHLKEEAGDLLCSVLALAAESDWVAEDLIRKTMDKITDRHLQYKTLGRKTTVAIMGTAADPIHNGHIAIAKFVLNTSRIFDEVWLMPPYEHMTKKCVASAEHRLAMCHLVEKLDARIKVFSYEIDRKLRGDTFHMVKSLLEEPCFAGMYDFSLIIGQDNANTFETWVGADVLEKMIRFVVVPRQGVKFNPDVTWYLKPPHIYLAADAPLTDISSSHIRDNLNGWQQWFDDLSQHDLDNFRHTLLREIPQSVLEYIIEHKLYGE